MCYNCPCVSCVHSFKLVVEVWMGQPIHITEQIKYSNQLVYNSGIAPQFKSSFPFRTDPASVLKRVTFSGYLCQRNLFVNLSSAKYFTIRVVFVTGQSVSCLSHLRHSSTVILTIFGSLFPWCLFPHLSIYSKSLVDHGGLPTNTF